MRDDLIITTRQGLYCPPGDFHIAPSPRRDCGGALEKQLADWVGALSGTGVQVNLVAGNHDRALAAVPSVGAPKSPLAWSWVGYG